MKDNTKPPNRDQIREEATQLSNLKQLTDIRDMHNYSK